MLALTLVVGSGCTTAATIPVTQGIVDGGLRGLDDPTNQQRLTRIVASPQIRAAQQDLIAQLLDTSLTTLSENDRAERLGRISARFTGSLIQGISRDLGSAIGGTTSAAVRGALDGTMSSAMSDARQKEMAQFVNSLVRATLDPALQSVSDADLGPRMASVVTNDLGPAIRTLLRDDLAPGLADAYARDDVRRAMGDNARLIGRELVIGIQQGIQAEKQARADEPLTSLGSLAREGMTVGRIVVWGLILGLVIALVALAVWVKRLLGETREWQNDASLRAESTRTLDAAIRAAEGKPWSAELLTSLEDRFRSDEDSLLRIRAARGRAGGAAVARNSHH